VSISPTRPGSVRAPAPALGAHMRALLAEAGYGEAEIDRPVAAVSAP
jgi:crotonobetainyl-CoA:carnitine CoA-transferase CaiB-like acyl-CoA transferase